MSCLYFFRCSCKFTTNDKNLFMVHTTTCGKSKRQDNPNAQVPLTFTYENEVFKCQRCDLTWADRAQFVEHIVCHTTDSPYICITCKQNFVSRDVIEKHSKMKHSAGDAKCGLMGIKKGRKIIESLLEKKECNVMGKLHIPETPRFESASTSKSKLCTDSMSTDSITFTTPTSVQQSEESLPIIASVHSLRPTVNSDLTKTHTIDKNVEKIETSSNVSGRLYSQLEESVVDESTNIPTKEQEKHVFINSLYGEFNSDCEVVPTHISSKIQKIVNVATTKPAPSYSDKDMSYHVKHITQYVPQGQNLNLTSSSFGQNKPIPVMLIPVQAPVDSKVSIQPLRMVNAPMISPNIPSTPALPSATGIINAPGMATVTSVAMISILTAPSISRVASSSNCSTMRWIGPSSTIGMSIPTVPSISTASVPSIFRVSGSETIGMSGMSALTGISPISTLLNAPLVATVNVPGTSNTPGSSANTFLSKSTRITAVSPKQDPLTVTVNPRTIVGQQIKQKKCQVFLYKPDYGFVCEVCKKFTKDESIFQKHIWDHIHGNPTACNVCTVEMIAKKQVDACLLIRNVFKNVKKGMDEQKNSVPVRHVLDGDKEIIEITDDDVHTDKPIPEVIVIDGECLTGGTEQDYNAATTESNDFEIPMEDNESLTKARLSPEEEKGAGSRVESMTEHHLPDSILNKSLNQTEEETESFVTKVLESTLKDFDPNIEKKDKNNKEQCVTSKKQKFIPPTSKKTDGSNMAENIKEFDANVVLAHSPDAFYMCGFDKCGFVCLSSQEYRNHMTIDKHKDEYCYICAHCGQKDYAEDNHVRHMHAHSNIKSFVLCKCPVRLCKYKTNQMNLFEAHLKAHSTEELTIKCTYCHTTFSSTSSLTEHLKKNLLKFVSCPYCTFKVGNKAIVKEHIKLNHPDRIRMISVSSQIVCYEREINFYVVPEAKKGNETEQTVCASNANVKQGTTDLDIPALLKEVQNKTNKKEHEDVGEHSDREELPDLDIGVEDQSITGRPEGIVDSLEKAKGQNNDHNTMVVYDAVGPKSLQCDVCSFVSYNQSLHLQHLSCHDSSPEREKQYMCMVCPKGHDGLSSLKSHLMNHPGTHEINLYRCTICVYCTNIKTHIVDHCRDNHTEKCMYTLKKETVYSTVLSCNHCGFKSRVPESIAQHEYHVHKIKPVVSVEPMRKKLSTEKAEVMDEGQATQHVDSSASRDPIRTPEKMGGKKFKYYCEYCKKFFKHKALLKEHMQKDHCDIQNKQFVFFKCKYCSYTSTMKDLILGHIGKRHPGKGIRILRKIENIGQNEDEVSNIASDSSETQSKKSDDVQPESNDDREPIEIPDGNIFQAPFNCPKCTFSSNLRLDTMRHVKTHPELKPVRPSMIKSTARKSTSSKNLQGKEALIWKRKSSLIQESTTKLQNPFVGLKESTGEESPPKDFYILGEQPLHSIFSACYIQLEYDLKYQCRICQQKIAKKFVLHRHILDHLKIVFFKCKYCTEGAIERTLLIGHIQKEHSFKPLQFVTVSKEELDAQFKERIFSLNFNDTLKLEESRKDVVKPISLGLKVKPVHEYNEIDPNHESETPNPPTETKPESKKNKLKCPKCRYIAPNRLVLATHITGHSNPKKNFLCSVCDYRGERFNVIKHISNAYHQTPAKTVEIETSAPETKSQPGSPLDDQVASPESDDNINDKSDTNDTSQKTFEMKNVYKCKFCGIKKNSVSAMYGHFHKTCGNPYLQCSLCKFQSFSKSDISKHGRIRHSGKTVSIKNLPAMAKIKVIKVRGPQQNTPATKPLMTVASTPEENISEDEIKEEVADPTSSELRCQLCKKFLCETPMKLQYHINTVHQGCMLYCQKCTYKTPLVKHMMNHCKNVHLQIKALYGIKSAIDISPKKETKQESVSEHDYKPLWQCVKCGLELSARGTLINHLYVHFEYRRFACAYCKRRSLKKCNLKDHIKAMHPNREIKYKRIENKAIEGKVMNLLEKAAKKIETQKKAMQPERPAYLQKFELCENGIRKHKDNFYCDFCGKQYCLVHNVRKHISSAHMAHTKKRSLDEKSVTEGPVLKVAKKEILTPTKPSSQKHVYESEVNRSDTPMRYKVRIVEGSKKIYCCVHCNYTSDKNKYLNRHFVRSHNPERTKKHTSDMQKYNYKCGYCSFKSRNQ